MSFDQPCPSCGAILPGAAVVCIDCGYDSRTGRKLKTVSKRITRRFGFSPIMPGRLAFAALFVLGAVFFAAVLPLHGLDPEHWGFYFFPIMGLLLLGAVVGLGSGGLTVVSRSRKGTPELVQQSWFCFIPLSPREFDLNEWEGVYFNCVFGGNRNTDVYILELGRNDGEEFATLYTGRDEDTMKRLGEAIKEVSGLRLERK